MADLLRLEGPPLPRVSCAMCRGAGLVALTAHRLKRECPTCRGSGLMVADQRFRDGIELRVYQLGLSAIAVSARERHEP